MGDILALMAQGHIWEINIRLHYMSLTGYRVYYVGEFISTWQTIDVAHFMSQPRHFAAIGGRYTGNETASETADNELGETPPGLAAVIRRSSETSATSWSAPCAHLCF